MEIFNHSVHLVGRHPEIVKDKYFLDWQKENGSEIWHETHADKDGVFTVIIQSLDKNNIIAYKLQRDSSFEKQLSLGSNILERRTFDLIKEKLSKSYALEVAYAEHSKDKIQAVRPVVDWNKKENSLSWEVEVNNGEKIQKFTTDGFNKLIFINDFEISKEKLGNPIHLFANDWLEENELHHLNRYRATAVQWATGGATVSDKVFRIWLKVRQTMVYDANVTHIGEFTWADNLIIDQLGYRGICDEWAVLQITMLRALGIPAVMKFMIFNYNGKQAGHACLEWSDNGTWKHLDALWSAYSNSAVYRQNGCSAVTVMDANFPRDNRYNGSAWGVPDVQGDGKMYPYGDYIINPNYPGNSRPGYSY
jgi:hypothetical protein